MSTSVAAAATSSAYWRAAGMTYLKYANLCAEVVRGSLKEPFLTKARLSASPPPLLAPPPQPLLPWAAARASQLALAARSRLLFGCLPRR